jgi:DNA-directed RNA polymerase subunit N
VLTNLGLSRYCCRRMLLTHVDLLDEVGPYG